ncbi:Thioredoxin-like 3-2, chloroplastic, partial [Mucuna pruriens]
MSQHLRILQPPPLSSIAPTIKPDSLSLCCFGVRFGFHSSVSPLISVSWGCARESPPVRLSQQGSLQEEEPVSLYLQPISSETHFDHVLAQAQTLHHAVVVVWGGLATLSAEVVIAEEKFYSVDVNTVSHKLVARAGVTPIPNNEDVTQRIQTGWLKWRKAFGFICDRKVPAKLKNKRGIPKRTLEEIIKGEIIKGDLMLWKDSKKQAEVIGGHKAYLVVNEVREMIEN